MLGADFEAIKHELVGGGAPRESPNRSNFADDVPALEGELPGPSAPELSLFPYIRRLLRLRVKENKIIKSMQIGRYLPEKIEIRMRHSFYLHCESLDDLRRPARSFKRLTCIHGPKVERRKNI